MASINRNARSSTYIWVLIMIFMLGCSVQYSVAQDVDYDYRAYKYYDDEPALLLPIADTLHTQVISAAAFAIRDRDMRRSLSLAGYRERGERSDEESYLLGEISVGRSVAHNLLSLGVASEKISGVGGSLYSGSTLSTTRFLVGRERHRRSEEHRIRAEFSGRSYVGGVSHRATWLPMSNGVRVDGGWVIGHNLRFRTGRDLYVEGVYTNSVDCGVEASYFNRRHSLSVAATLTYNDRGLRQSSTEEAFSLLNNNLYNPSWGLQHGKVRNSRVSNNIRPDIIAIWDYRLTSATTLHLATNIGFEWQGVTSLTWFDAVTPMPDNYRYMPSYYSDDSQQVEVTEAWVNNDTRFTQIDWDGLYHTNMLQMDGHSRYAVVRRCENLSHVALSASISSRLASVDIVGGVKFYYDGVRSFQVMDDLLGGTHIIDKDYYLINDATYSNNLQNNLLTPNRRVVEGDRFGYDYRISSLSAMLFGRASWRYKSGGVGISLATSTEGVRRRGFYEKELFSGAGSLGYSSTIKMLPYHIAASWEHGIYNHRVGASFMVRGSAPESEDMFLQSEYNNRIVNDLSLAHTVAGEASYRYFIAKRLALSATLFASYSADGCDMLHYFDDLSSQYVDCVVSGVDRFTGGVEVKVNVEWSRYLSSLFMATAFASRYTDSARVLLYSDASNAHLATTISNIEGCRTGTPEISVYGDISFRHSGWMAQIAGYYVGERHVTPSYVRRTERVLNSTSSALQREEFMFQQRFDDIFGIDISLSKWFNFNDISLGFQFSIHNLLGQSSVSGGFEQNRVQRLSTPNGGALQPFANRITYGYPRLYSFSISLRFANRGKGEN